MTTTRITNWRPALKWDRRLVRDAQDTNLLLRPPCKALGNGQRWLIQEGWTFAGWTPQSTKYSCQPHALFFRDVQGRLWWYPGDAAATLFPYPVRQPKPSTQLAS